MESQTDWDKGDFEGDVYDHSEVKQNEHKSQKQHLKESESKQYEKCKVCEGNFSNLFMHLLRSAKDCKEGYGDEFEKIKEEKAE